MLDATSSTAVASPAPMRDLTDDEIHHFLETGNPPSDIAIEPATETEEAFCLAAHRKILQNPTTLGLSYKNTLQEPTILGAHLIWAYVNKENRIPHRQIFSLSTPIRQLEAFAQITHPIIIRHIFAKQSWFYWEEMTMNFPEFLAIHVTNRIVDYQLVINLFNKLVDLNIEVDFKKTFSEHFLALTKAPMLIYAILQDKVSLEFLLEKVTHGESYLISFHREILLAAHFLGESAAFALIDRLCAELTRTNMPQFMSQTAEGILLYSTVSYHWVNAEDEYGESIRIHKHDISIPVAARIRLLNHLADKSIYPAHILCLNPRSLGNFYVNEPTCSAEEATQFVDPRNHTPYVTISSEKHKDEITTADWTLFIDQFIGGNFSFFSTPGETQGSPSDDLICALYLHCIATPEKWRMLRYLLEPHGGRFSFLGRQVTLPIYASLQAAKDTLPADIQVAIKRLECPGKADYTKRVKTDKGSTASVTTAPLPEDLQRAVEEYGRIQAELEKTRGTDAAPKEFIPKRSTASSSELPPQAGAGSGGSHEVVLRDFLPALSREITDAELIDSLRTGFIPEGMDVTEEQFFRIIHAKLVSSSTAPLLKGVYQDELTDPKSVGAHLVWAYGNRFAENEVHPLLRGKMNLENLAKLLALPQLIIFTSIFEKKRRYFEYSDLINFLEFFLIDITIKIDETPSPDRIMATHQLIGPLLGKGLTISPVLAEKILTRSEGGLFCPPLIALAIIQGSISPKLIIDSAKSTTTDHPLVFESCLGHSILLSTLHLMGEASAIQLIEKLFAAISIPGMEEFMRQTAVEILCYEYTYRFDDRPTSLPCTIEERTFLLGELAKKEIYPGRILCLNNESLSTSVNGKIDAAKVITFIDPRNDNPYIIFYTEKIINELTSEDWRNFLRHFIDNDYSYFVIGKIEKESTIPEESLFELYVHCIRTKSKWIMLWRLLTSDPSSPFYAFSQKISARIYALLLEHKDTFPAEIQISLHELTCPGREEYERSLRDAGETTLLSRLTRFWRRDSATASVSAAASAAGSEETTAAPSVSAAAGAGSGSVAGTVLREWGRSKRVIAAAESTTVDTAVVSPYSAEALAKGTLAETLYNRL